MITVMAYKSDSDDYCRGCHMASYSSDFKWLSNASKEETIEFIASVLSYVTDRGECSYEVTVLIDGEEYPEEDSLKEEVLGAAQRLAKQKLEQHKADIIKAKAESERISKQQAEREERKRLAELKAKYETT